MKDKSKKHETIDDFIRTCPEDAKGPLLRLRSVIKEIVPKGEETISYGIPTFKLNGKNLIHFGGFKDHISLFPGSSGIEAFKKELSGYKTSKGTIKFPIDEPFPWTLIKKIVRYRVKENLKGR